MMLQHEVRRICVLAKILPDFLGYWRRSRLQVWTRDCVGRGRRVFERAMSGEGEGWEDVKDCWMRRYLMLSRDVLRSGSWL